MERCFHNCSLYMDLFLSAARRGYPYTHVGVPSLERRTGVYTHWDTINNPASWNSDRGLP